MSNAPPAPANGGARLGDLSMRFETGFRPGEEAQAAAVVSTGRGDPGGVSYGAYQLASSAQGGHQVQAFQRAEGLPWDARFTGQAAGTTGGDFGDTWRAVAGEDPQGFFLAQHNYIQRTHYAPTVHHVREQTGLDIGTRSRSVQNVVWSMSVQHGRAPRLVAASVQAVGPQGERSDTEYDRDLIDRLYDDREAYVDALGLTNLRARYRSERRDALQALRDAP